MIGVTGFKRHGKDTVARWLVDEYGFERIAFADALKDACSAAFGIDRAIFDDDERKELPSEMYPDWTHRLIMQYVGTDLFRSTWPTIWIDTWRRRVADKSKVVVTDLRFSNEETAVRLYPHNYIIRVHDPRKPTSTDPHPSEVEIGSINADTMILNDSGIGELWDAVDKFILGDFRTKNGILLERT